MQAELGIRNIVLVGQFSPTIFDKFFFIKNEIFKEEDIKPNSIFANPSTIQVITNRFQIVIAINQIVISAVEPKKENELHNIASSLVQCGNIKTTTAMGINFHWFLSDPSKSLEEYSREIFFDNKYELYTKYFNKSDALFGIYASVDFRDSRLKLDVKPVKSQLIQLANLNMPDSVNFIFNFHFDIKQKEDFTELLNYLMDYDIYLKESERMISLYTER
jgi:hypothetical protein